MKRKLYFLMLLSVTAMMSLNAQIVYELPEKKLIDFGWNSPFVREYRENMKLYESGPFDGLTLKLSQEVCNGNVFMVDDWSKIKPQARENEKKMILSLEKSKILTDNFIVIYGASQMDWFSDKDWALAEEQIRFAARLAKSASCKGVLWDPEPYKPGKNPWKYSEQEMAAQYTLEDYYVQVRKRGAQFIKALQEEFPGIVIFSLRELSDWQNGSPFSGALLPVTSRENTIKELENGWWGLHPAFYAGLLDGIEPGTELIDTNEEAYYYTSALEYYAIRSALADDARAFVPPELWSKHASFLRIGHAISADYIAGNWLGMSPFPYRLTGQGLMMKATDRAKWFEHNAYYALRTSDRYAWLYTEGYELVEK
ncbi:MAG: hypothetical protein IPN67_11255 [Bacteroidales bacterium]|nr:hypothetical protein [Bacteroidales bacterium]